jgi:hypothetical protein
MRARVVYIALFLAACSTPPEEPAERGRERALSESAEVPPLPPSTHPAPARLVAIGDVHGDLDAFRSALRLAGAVDDGDHWIGDALWIVQTGDLLDRGDEEDEILALVARLEREARAAGGSFVALNGNHEIMNAQGDFRYVTPDGFRDFDAFASRAPRAARARLPREMHGRAGAFAPGGRYARELAARSTVVVVGDTVLVHGGLAPRQLERGLDANNGEVRRFLLGQAPLSPLLAAEDSPVWHRDFALSDDPATCAVLEEVLSRLGARRMVVGHTVQPEGINAACDERVWRIDVGLARYYGGSIEVLEIAGGRARVLHGTR